MYRTRRVLQRWHWEGIVWIIGTMSRGPVRRRLPERRGPPFFARNTPHSHPRPTRSHQNGLPPANSVKKHLRTPSARPSELYSTRAPAQTFGAAREPAAERQSSFQESLYW